MTTASFVGRVNLDGSFVAHTVTYDGYPAGVGASLAGVLASDWAQGSPARLLAELASFRHWWSIGLDLDGPTRVGWPNQRPEEQNLPLSTGRLGQPFRDGGQPEWGYLFRGEDELVVVKSRERWQTPVPVAQQWSVIDLGSIGFVDWERLGRTNEPGRQARRPTP